MRDNREDRYEDILFGHGDRRKLDLRHGIGIGSEKIVQTKIVEEVHDHRIPPVEKEIVQGYVIVRKVGEGDP